MSAFFQIASSSTPSISIVSFEWGIAWLATGLGTGVRGDGPETDPLQCRLSRPHGLFADADGTLYVTDSEAHRIRVLTR